MNPDRSSINLINRARADAYDFSVPDEGNHDMRFNTLDDPDTKTAFKNKEAIQGAIKSLKQADQDLYGKKKILHTLQDKAREISRREDPDEIKDILAKNHKIPGDPSTGIKANRKNVKNSFREHYGYNRLERETKRKQKGN